MKRRLTITFIIVLIITVGFTAWYSRSGPGRGQQNFAAAAGTDLIKTSFPQHKDINITAHFIGRAESRNTITIMALEAGTILSVDAAEESAVKKGTVLFTLGGAKVSASITGIRQKIESLKQRQALAKTAVVRKQRALEQKIASFDELDKAKIALAVLDTQLEEAAGRSNILENAIHIKTPVSGIFTNRRVSTGQAVEKGTPLAEIIVPAELRVRATLFPPQDTQLQGRAAAVYTAGGKMLSGIVTGILPQRTSAGGTMVWLESGDINRQLKPGELVNGDIQLAVHKKTLTLPEKAIVRDEREKTYVFVKQADGYVKQKVRTGPSSDGWVEILSGITGADEVVTEGAYELFYRDFNNIWKVAD